MIKVLIIDDSPEKIERIKKVLEERCLLAEEDISVAKSVSSGKKSLKGQLYDLVILDLFLPQFDDERPIEDGGLSFLRTLNVGSDDTLPLQIICLTEYADVLNHKKDAYDNLMVSAILKNEGDSLWIDQLVEKVNYSKNLRYHVEYVLNNRSKFDVGIVCALQEEFEMLLEAFGRDKWVDYPIEGCPYQLKQILLTTESMQTLKIIASCVCKPGGIATAALTSYMLGGLHVDYIFMTGITGGIKKEDIRHGDIIVSKSAQEYAVGKITEGGEGNIVHLKENSMTPANIEMVNKISEFLSCGEIESLINSKIRAINLKVEERDLYRTHIAPTVSGPFVMTSKQVVEELIKTDRKLRGIDMEGYALYYAAHVFNKPALWIKGVSDMADPSKDDKYHKVSAYGSAYLLYLFLKRKLLG